MQTLSLDRVKSLHVEQKNEVLQQDIIKVGWEEVENEGRVSEYLMYEATFAKQKHMRKGILTPDLYTQKEFAEAVQAHFVKEFNQIPYDLTIFSDLQWTLDSHGDAIAILVSVGIITLEDWKRTNAYTRKAIMKAYGKKAQHVLNDVQNSLIRLGKYNPFEKPKELTPVAQQSPANNISVNVDTTMIQAMVDAGVKKAMEALEFLEEKEEGENSNGQ